MGFLTLWLSQPLQQTQYFFWFYSFSVPNSQVIYSALKTQKLKIQNTPQKPIKKTFSQNQNKTQKTFPKIKTKTQNAKHITADEVKSKPLNSSYPTNSFTKPKILRTSQRNTIRDRCAKASS